MDLIENGSDDGHFGGDVDDSDDLTWGHPSVLAIASIILAFLVLNGAILLRGATYVTTFAVGRELTNDNGHTWTIVGALVAVALSLIPLGLAQLGLQRVVTSDGAWTAHLLRAAFALSCLAVVLRLVVVLISLHDSGTGGLTAPV